MKSSFKMAFGFQIEKLISSTSGKFADTNKLLIISATIAKFRADSMLSFTNNLREQLNFSWLTSVQSVQNMSLENTNAQTIDRPAAALPISSNNPYVRQTNCIIMYITSKLCATVIECVWVSVWEFWNWSFSGKRLKKLNFLISITSCAIQSVVIAKSWLVTLPLATGPLRRQTDFSVHIGTIYQHQIESLDNTRLVLWVTYWEIV